MKSYLELPQEPGTIGELLATKYRAGIHRIHDSSSSNPNETQEEENTRPSHADTDLILAIDGHDYGGLTAKVEGELEPLSEEERGNVEGLLVQINLRPSLRAKSVEVEGHYRNLVLSLTRGKRPRFGESIAYLKGRIPENYEEFLEQQDIVPDEE